MFVFPVAFVILREFQGNWFLIMYFKYRYLYLLAILYLTVFVIFYSLLTIELVPL